MFIGLFKTNMVYSSCYRTYDSNQIKALQLNDNIKVTSFLITENKNLFNSLPMITTKKISNKRILDGVTLGFFSQKFSTAKSLIM